MAVMPGSAAQADEVRQPMGELLLWFFRLLWRARPWAVLGDLSLMVFQGVVPALQLTVSAHLYDAVAGMAAGRNSVAAAWPWLGGLLGVRLLQALASAGRAACQALSRERVGVELQRIVIEQAGRVSLEEYEQETFHDRLQRAIQASVWRSFSIFTNALGTVEQVISLASLLILLIGGHPAVPLILAVGAVPTLWSHLRRGRETYRLYRRQTPEQRRANYYVELLTNRDAAKELRLYGLGQHLLQLWADLAGYLRRERVRLAMRQQVRLGLARTVSLAAYGGSLALLLWRASGGAITVGALVALTQAASRFQGQLGAVLRSVSQLYEELLYLADLREFTFASADAVVGGPRVQLPPGPCSIEFEHVSFAYPGGELVLKDLTFTIQAGEKIALVGENGSGKTTLIKLLLGLYRPTEGRILIDGVDLREIDPDSLRRKAAAVFQDFLRYQLTARENVGFGRVERLQDREALADAVRAGGAEAVVERLPAGLDTILGRYFEGGQDLSGGQWQKLAIARAFFRDAQILVLDEPTAALDPRAELELFQRFRALAGGRTAIFVSHRMASARIADRILVLQRGQLLEAGSHDELVQRGGEYARMFSLQARWYRDEEPTAQWDEPDVPAPSRWARPLGSEAGVSGTSSHDGGALKRRHVAGSQEG